MSSLFSPYTLKSTTLRNRIVASPMCQYMAKDGHVNDWHRTHYATLARGGAGLVIVEATAVSPEGRITPGDLGLWSDAHATGLADIAATVKAAGAVAGIQLAHAGRKAGCAPPWEGGAPLHPDDPQAWQPVAPSALAYLAGSDYIPRALTIDGIRQVREAFVEAAVRAREAGFEWLELHFAHGFLAHTFLSPHANTRDDAYGGSLENRARFLLETLRAVQEVWPQQLPLTVRLGVVAFDGGEQDLQSEAVEVLAWMKQARLDLVDASLSMTSPGETIPWGTNMMLPYAAPLRAATGLPVATSWHITSAREADAFVREGKLDLVYFGRRLLANPHWPYHAARELGIEHPADVLPTTYSYWLKSWDAHE
jgi:2,4-dienoyl-CoA reductase-like NADH-dependent reductase (Old Yellow Enzyme family)